MWSSLVCLVAVLAVVSADECQDYSYAPLAVDQIANQGGQLEKGRDFDNAFKILGGILRDVQSPYRNEIFYGLDNDDYYSVFDCGSEAYADSALCTEGAVMIFSTRNLEAFGDRFIHYFRVLDNGYLALRSFYTSSEEFFPTQQDWYNIGSGWTNPRVQVSGATGITYWNAFAGGVAGGDRLRGESCGPCLTGSFPVPFAMAYADGRAPDGSEALSIGQLEIVGKYLVSVVQGMTHEFISEAFVGYDNDLFIGIGDCRNEYQECAREYPDGWILYSKNPFLFQNSESICRAQLNNIGEIVDDDFDCGDEVFVTRQRPWFALGKGWASPFTSATTGLTIRTYSFPFNGGVAAAEIFVGEDEECAVGDRHARDGEYAYEFYCEEPEVDSAAKILLSLSLVLLSVIFALI